jgi:hypothetical protein
MFKCQLFILLTSLLLSTALSAMEHSAPALKAQPLDDDKEHVSSVKVRPKESFDKIGAGTVREGLSLEQSDSVDQHEQMKKLLESLQQKNNAQPTNTIE